MFGCSGKYATKIKTKEIVEFKEQGKKRIKFFQTNDLVTFVSSTIVKKNAFAFETLYMLLSLDEIKQIHRYISMYVIMSSLGAL